MLVGPLDTVPPRTVTAAAKEPRAKAVEATRATLRSNSAAAARASGVVSTAAPPPAQRSKSDSAAKRNAKSMESKGVSGPGVARGGLHVTIRAYRKGPFGAAETPWILYLR